MTTYETFLDYKTQLGGLRGFAPTFVPDFLFGFQKHLVEWSVRKGCCAMFADCGLGKTPMQLVWAENVRRKTNKPTLILTPLAVGAQTVRQGDKFGIESARSRDGTLPCAPIVVANYEKLHLFNPVDFGGVVCDESSILKNFDGATRAAVTDFMRKMEYRLLCTATAAPNDYIELGTSSEAIGDLGFADMLTRFFKKTEATSRRADEFKCGNYRFRGHGQRDFWRWVCSWARAVRKPSDLGFPDDGFALPALTNQLHIVKAEERPEGFLFDMPAVSLQEQRQERRRSLTERCEKVASLVNDTGKPFVSWCNLNDEGDLLDELIPDAVQISGKDSDDRKEEVFTEFELGNIRGIISKPVIAGLGLNWQHCAHQTTFPSHSFEQWYQSVRRSWRFGQKSDVVIDMITSEGESRVLANLERKQRQAEQMFSSLVSLMNEELKIERANNNNTQTKLPSWL